MRPLESQHCYSNRLIQQFARLLRTYPAMPPEALAGIETLEEDGRTPIATVHELLRGAILITGDEDIGLKAAELIEIGDYGALEYAASTAQTAGEAFTVIGRYMHLINDALTFSIRVEGEHAILSFENAVVMPRAAEDFELGAFFAAARARTADLRWQFEVRFVHEAPAHTAMYERVFTANATVRFAQAYAGFLFPREALTERLPTADPRLHAVMRSHADRLLQELPKVESLTARVREQLMNLASGPATLADVASALHLSERTLARKLEHEGTSFKNLLEDLRRRLALRYVGDSDLAFSEIAFLLGFSQVAAFHRAFKRWTDQTPLEHRTGRRG
ncbi:MAG TPA: AraC family transcriptional regulator ligand-binding domain-containing protein [Polyangiales bacterium]|nr:AraC family transcriptional regulator ligand-binding domain-containing protein [Polyangiales bacterium]